MWRRFFFVMSHQNPEARVTLEQLLQELPLEDGGLVPLALIVERVTNTAYQMIQSLSDTLPSLSSDAKRAKIFTTALELRRLFVKLLVIVRWTKDSDMLNRARNVVALLVEQQWAHEDAFSGLTQVRKILPNARMSDADFVTAIDVLCTGTYQRLPASIKDSTVMPTPLSNEEARNIMANLDRILRVRLAWTESIPMKLRLKCIADGKAYMESPGLYDICLTVQGPEKQDRWWLLDFHFADQVNEDEQEPTWTETYLDRIFEKAEAIFAPEVNEDDAPTLMRLHNMLEQEALQRQLHIVHRQLQRMSCFNWGRHIRYTLKEHVLDIWYWIGHSELQGHITLHLESLPLQGPYRVLSEIMSGTNVIANLNRIQVQWHLDDEVRAHVPRDEQTCTLERLDIEALVLLCIRRHSHALLRRFEAQIGLYEGLCGSNPGLCRLCMHNDNGYGPQRSLQLQLTQTMRVMLYISTISGRIGLKLLEAHPSEMVLSLSQSQNAALQQMADRIQTDLSSVADTLFTFRMQCFTKNLQLQMAWLGLPCTTSLSLRSGELSRMGLQKGYPLLYVPLGILPGYHLMLYFEPQQQLGMALVLITSEMENGKTMHVISSVKWLSKTHLSQFSVQDSVLVNAPTNIASELHDPHTRDRIHPEELELALHYCAATVVYSHLEEQLRLKLVPFVLLDGKSHATPPPTGNSSDPLLPSLCIQACKLLTSYQDLIKPNMSLQLCEWWLPVKRRVVMHFKVNLEEYYDMEPLQLSDRLNFDPSSGVFAFTCYDLTASLTKFQQAWEQIARMCLLLNTVTSWNTPNFSLSLQSLTWQQVTLTYGENEYDRPFFLQVKFNLVERLEQPRYFLECGVQHSAMSNPHQYILRTLERSLNAHTDDAKKIWYTMFQVRTKGTHTRLWHPLYQYCPCFMISLKMLLYRLTVQMCK